MLRAVELRNDDVAIKFRLSLQTTGCKQRLLMATDSMDLIGS